MARRSDSGKPALELIGKDGNAFAILGRARRAAKLAGWSDEYWDAVHKDARSGDYDHLLAVMMKHFEVV